LRRTRDAFALARFRSGYFGNTPSGADCNRERDSRKARTT